MNSTSTMETLENYSDSHFQDNNIFSYPDDEYDELNEYFVDDTSVDHNDLDNYIDDNLDDDLCVCDFENKEIDKLTKIMNEYKLRLEKFDNEPLHNISDIKRDFYLLCENNRYLIEDSIILNCLESSINKYISEYEDKLFMLSELLVDEETKDEKIKETKKN